MNTISRYQIFSPIPFIEFHPDIIYTSEAPHEEVDVSSNCGKYDEQNYNNLAFYIKDYNASTEHICSYIFYEINSTTRIKFIISIFVEISCCVSVRQTVEASIPLARSDKDIAALLKLSEHSPVTSLFEMYVSFSDMHILRAIEPTLKIKYKDVNCEGISNDNIYKSCIKLRNNHLGKRSQLARLVLDFQSYQV